MTMIENRAKTTRRLLRNQHGQSVVEYLIVIGALVSALIAAPSAFNMVRGMMQNKYSSYSFGVAISDPPTSDFDEEVKRDAKAVKEAMDALHALEQFIEHPSLPEPYKPHWPDVSNMLKE
ncbi:MAG: hypothetical protein VR65_14620 [Desulfobulbaceae bacterium BRH_c16a]|nr:MAG: hypothetical protein VR65_14620 [Desulfobulbaceae bacterium BRH_c16a]